MCISYLSFCIIYHSIRPAGSGYAIELWIPNFIIHIFPKWILIILSHMMWAFLALGLLAYDLLFCSILIQTAMYIDILKYKLQNISMHDPIKKRQILIQCIQQHLAICKIKEKIQSIFFIVISVLPVFLGVNMCLGIYQATLWETNDTATLTAFGLFTTSAFLEGFSVCWVASDITYKSGEIRNAVYEMDWIGIDKYTGKMIIILMAYSTSRPMHFVGILSISMSNHTFRAILNISYQFYLLLRHIAHSKNN
uniref:Olfactory receptor 87 n=1 Tax=Aulacocentrum confusum TaxID=2767324 RepID=A0A7G8Z9A6_9HYME|nr:olfactory receptor 87 [Aulacocentrum confusum]